MSDGRTAWIDSTRSACLCDAGAPDYLLGIAIGADGQEDFVLIHQSVVGDENHTYNRTTPEAPHEQIGPLPLEYVRRITISRRTHRCGCPTKTTGRPCRTPVVRPGDACGWHRTEARHS